METWCAHSIRISQANTITMGGRNFRRGSQLTLVESNSPKVSDLPSIEYTARKTSGSRDLRNSPILSRCPMRMRSFSFHKTMFRKNVQESPCIRSNRCATHSWASGTSSWSWMLPKIRTLSKITSVPPSSPPLLTIPNNLKSKLWSTRLKRRLAKTFRGILQNLRKKVYSLCHLTLHSKRTVQWKAQKKKESRILQWNSHVTFREHSRMEGKWLRHSSIVSRSLKWLHQCPEAPKMALMTSNRHRLKRTRSRPHLISKRRTTGIWHHRHKWTMPGRQLYHHKKLSPWETSFKITNLNIRLWTLMAVLGVVPESQPPMIHTMENSNKRAYQRWLNERLIQGWQCALMRQRGYSVLCPSMKTWRTLIEKR